MKNYGKISDTGIGRIGKGKIINEWKFFSPEYRYIYKASIYLSAKEKAHFVADLGEKKPLPTQTSPNYRIWH